MAADELIITADTIVILADQVMGKPKDADEAYKMLHQLSGKTHQVITGVCLTTHDRQVSFSVETDVTFKTLSDEKKSTTMWSITSPLTRLAPMAFRSG